MLWAERAPAIRGPLLALGLAGVALLALALILTSRAGIGWAIFILAAEYILSLEVADSGIDLWSPLFAAALLIVAELAAWSSDARWPTQRASPLTARRAGIITLITASALGLGILLLAPAVLPVTTGLPLTAAGVLAAAAALGLVAVLATRGRERG